MIIIMGIAGAGKSVQGKLLAKSKGYQWISTGELLRKNISLSRNEEMRQGKLLSDEEIIDIIKKELINKKDNEQVVLDGFPRTLTQAEWLMTLHGKNDINIDLVLKLEIGRNTVIKRLLSRGRPDDNEQAINLRFKEYEEFTLPIINLYKDRGIRIVFVNGDQPVDKVHKDILQATRQI